METKERAAYAPDYAVHPGEYLEEVLETRGIKKRELAERLGISVKHLSQIINGQAGLGAAMAVQLERILGVSAAIWNNLNADYELFQERKKAEDRIAARQEWLAAFPVRDLKKLGYLPDSRDKKILIDAALRFFGLPDTGQWDSYYERVAAANYRRSPSFTDNLAHLASWLRAGEIEAQAIVTAPYSREIFKNKLAEIRTLTIKEPGIFESELKRLCAESGIALALVPEFDKTHVSGATCWLSPERALITLSLRHKTNDHFWFTFFHEAAHVLLHGKKDIFIDDPEGFASKEEEEADRFARNSLIPEAEWRRFVGAGQFFEPQILAFSARVGIHPGIVVGRLQRETLIEFKWHNGLKQKLGLAAGK